MRTLTLYRDDSTTQVVFENVKHFFFTSGNTVLTIAQYVDIDTGAHRYIHWPRERFCWFKDEAATMSEFRQRAIEDVAREISGDRRTTTWAAAIHAYAVSQRERVLELEAALHSIATWRDCALRPDELHGEALEAFSLGSSKAFEQQAKIARDALTAEATHEA